MNRFAASAIILALALSGLPARADNTADEADLRFKRGVEFYRGKKFEDALAEFFHSNRLVKNKNVILNIARCYEQLKQYDEAYRYYDEALGENWRADDRRGIEESLARLAPMVALVRVESDTPGADIYIERKDLGSRGTTPKTLALPPGRATVILSLAGYRDATQKVALSTGHTSKVNLQLDFIYGTVELSGSPAGAQVRVDKSEGAADGTLPGKLKLKPGRHILQISADDFLASQLPVDIKGDDAVKAEVKLQPVPPPTGNLMVTANHEGALVRVDGKEMGFTPTVVPLPVGKHRVMVVMQEMRPFQQDVNITQDQATVIKAELRYGGGVTTAASKTETAVEDAPASVTVISREEIQAFGYTTLPEALRGVRGMFTSNDRSYEYLGVRGFSPPGDLNNRILILYDGHPMNDIYAGQAYFGRENNIDLNEVDRIEVVRGPVSSLFGSAAFFGVINIVPRHKLDQKNAEVSGGAGSLGLGRIRATGGLDGKGGEALLSLGALRATGDEFYTVPATDTAPATMMHNRDGELVVNGNGRARVGEFSFLGTINSRTKQLPTGAYDTVLNGPATEMIDQRGFAEARWDHQGQGGATLAARAYYDATRYRGQYPYPDSMETDRGGADWGGLEVRYRSAELLSQNLTLGLEFQQQFRIYQTVVIDGAKGLDDTRQFSIASAYAADELHLGSHLLINASARADYYVNSFGLTVNPRLAIIAKPWAGGITKLMGGRSFRAPTAYERFYYDGSPDPITGKIEYLTSKPNEKLRPETILTGEFEHTQEIGDNFRIVGAVFLNRLSDLIFTTTDPADGLQFSSNAAGTVQTRGAEAEVRWQPARLTMLSVAYWYQQMVIEGISDPAEQERLRSNAPAHAFSVRGMFPISAPFVIGSAEAIYNSTRLTRDGSERTGEFLFLNLGLSGQLANASFRYFAGVQNLLDERPQIPVSEQVASLTIPSYGRTFLIQAAAAY